ncbi:MAG: hypothetical protein QG657_3517 [Acidobacteriota bacterium]|nr:hypothetical protein [Acidobacteriota bacterium]
MTDVTITNNCQLATWEVLEKSGYSAPIDPGGNLTVPQADLTDPNSLPIQLVSGDANGTYNYTIGTAAPVAFTPTNSQYTIPLPTVPADFSMSTAGPINVSIGDGQGEF